MIRDPTAVANVLDFLTRRFGPGVGACDADGLLHYVGLCAVDEAQHLGALRGRDLESVEGGFEMANKALPVALADAHPARRRLHAAADVIERAAGARAQKIDQQLLFAAYAVLRPVLPEPSQLSIPHQLR